MIKNLKLENKSEFPFSVSDLIGKNERLLSNMCGMVPNGDFVLSGTPEKLVLNTPLNTEHIYAVAPNLELTLISQSTKPLSLAQLKCNLKK